MGDRSRMVPKYVRLGLAILLAVVLPGTAQAADRQINFDEVSAPCLFLGEKLTTRYQALGVVFSGAAPGQGGEILNQCAGFGVSGYSPPNFLAFNPVANAGGPETLQFSPAASSVAVNVGGSFSATATFTAFDGAAMAAESSRILGPGVATLSVAAGHITSARIASDAGFFVVDDLVWSTPPPPVNPVSNSFSLGKPKLNKKKGTATLTVTVPNPGELTASGNGVKASSVGRAVTSKSVGAGQAQLLVKAKGKKKRKLNETGEVKLSVAITYTPTGGDPSTQSVKVKLKKRL